MGKFRPKDVFRKAREAERRGQKRTASSQYASLAIYLRRHGNPKDAKALVERAIVLSPESPRLYVQLALCDLALKEEPEARKAISLFARYTVRRGKVDEYGPYLEAQLKPYPALRQVFYEALLELDRTRAEPFLQLAQCLAEQGKLEPAQGVLLDALRTKTQSKEVVEKLEGILRLRERGDGLKHLAQFQAGKLSREDLCLILSDDSPRYEGSGKAKPKTATSTVPRGKRNEPTALKDPDVSQEKNLQTLIREMEAEMGISLDEGRDSVEPLVREFRQKSSKILGNDAKARMDMALAFYEMGLMDHARDELLRISETDSLYLESQCLMGEILCAEGSDLGAMEVFQKCLRDERARDEIANEARYKLVQIYLRLGDIDQGLKLVTQLERKAPFYRDLKNLKVLLQEKAAARRPERNSTGIPDEPGDDLPINSREQLKRRRG